MRSKLPYLLAIIGCAASSTVTAGLIILFEHQNSGRRINDPYGGQR